MPLDQLDLQSRRSRCARCKGSITNWQEMDWDEAAAIRAWLPCRPFQASKFLFVTCRDGPIDVSMFRRIVKSIGVEAGVPHDRAHPHALKHSLAVHMVEADIPVQLVQRRLGHRNIQNTMIYVAIADSHVDRVIRDARSAGYIA